jgi:long-chain acyl-CoA synthetase
VGALLGGTPFAPQFIENKLKFSPYIREAVAFGHDRPFVAAMIAVDPGTTGSWAERHDVTYTSYMDLSQRPEVLALIRDEIRKCNATLPDAIRVRRFALLSKELDADDAEVTRTRKVRRHYVAQKYADVIEAFYSGRDAAELAATVTYEDGRQATVRSRLRMVDVESAAEEEAVHV